MVVEVGDVLYSLSLIILGSVRVTMANGTYRQIIDMLVKLGIGQTCAQAHLVSATAA